MNQQRANTGTSDQFRNTSDFLISGSIPQPAVASNIRSRNPPPIPPRPGQNYNNYNVPNVGTYNQSYLNGYGYGNNPNYRRFGGYGYNAYSTMPAYNSYGQFGGPSGNMENRFVQIAEEGTRPAFQSIEAMVHTFSSVTMMLESTFFAMTSSFRAILSVAENVGRLRSMFSQFLSTFALIRFARWLYGKIMHMLGLHINDPNDEAIWQKTALKVLNGEERGPSTWPILLFFSMLFAIPYLVHKLVHDAAQVKVNANDPKEWLQCNEPIYTATASYDFNATSPEELNLRVGQKVWLAPEPMQLKGVPGWCRATDNVNVGLIPSSYVTLVGQLKKKTGSEQSQTPLLQEASASTNGAIVEEQPAIDDACNFENFEQSFKIEK